MAMSDLDTDDVGTLIASGISGLDHPDVAAASERLKRAAARDPQNAELHFRLGECFWRLGDFGAAIHAFERAISLKPDYVAAYRCAADAASAQAGKAAAASNDKAARDLRKFAAMYLLALGKLQHQQFLDDAEPTLREATALDPKSAEAFWALGAFLESRGRSSDAEKPLRRAIALDPKMAAAYVSLGNTFQSRWRFVEMDAAYRKALALKPDLHHVRESLTAIPLMNMLYDDKSTPPVIYERHRAWGDEVARELRMVTASPPAFQNSRDPDRKLRVAYFSGDFRYHAVSFFFHALLAHHDPEKIEVFCYGELEKPDVVTSFLQNIGGIWRNTYQLDDATLRRQIRADQIDITIDLAGHTSGNRLRALASRPAPVTASWLGYPATTGLSTIDWRITDARVDPPGREADAAARCLLVLHALYDADSRGGGRAVRHARRDHLWVVQHAAENLAASDRCLGAHSGGYSECAADPQIDRLCRAVAPAVFSRPFRGPRHRTRAHRAAPAAARACRASRLLRRNRYRTRSVSL
jgi:protein O-GlcNAc transferase